MLLRKDADSRYTIKSQLPPAIAATIIAIQYAVNYQTFMVFLYMYVLSISLRRTELMGRICNSKIPAVMLMGKSPLKYRN
jgi:hypothetical protein